MPKSSPRKKTWRTERVKSSDVFRCPKCGKPLDIVHVTEYSPFAEGLKVICRNQRSCQYPGKWITTKNKIPDD